MYGALEDQLREQDCALTVAALRKRTAEYMRSHSEDFLPFLTNLNTGNVYTPGSLVFCPTFSGGSGFQIKFFLGVA